MLSALLTSRMESDDTRLLCVVMELLNFFVLVAATATRHVSSREPPPLGTVGPQTLAKRPNK